MTVSYDRSQVVIGVGGEVDMLTAPDLTAVLDAVIDQGHTTVVLDLGELAFIDCAGLRGHRRHIVPVTAGSRGSGSAVDVAVDPPNP